jgi:hypothetical protein
MNESPRSNATLPCEALRERNRPGARA